MREALVGSSLGVFRSQTGKWKQPGGARHLPVPRRSAGSLASGVTCHASLFTTSDSAPIAGGPGQPQSAAFASSATELRDRMCSCGGQLV